MRQYIGIPFNELDCYGLVRHFYKQEFGIDLMDFNMKYSDGSNEYFAKVFINYQNYATQWQKVETPKYGDVIALKYNLQMPKVVTHFSIALNENEMIHTTNKTGSIIEPISRYKRIIEGFYRYEPNNNI